MIENLANVIKSNLRPLTNKRIDTTAQKNINKSSESNPTPKSDRMEFNADAQRSTQKSIQTAQEKTFDAQGSMLQADQDRQQIKDKLDTMRKQAQRAQHPMPASERADIEKKFQQNKADIDRMASGQEADARTAVEGKRPTRIKLEVLGSRLDVNIEGTSSRELKIQATSLINAQRAREATEKVYTAMGKVEQQQVALAKNQDQAAALVDRLAIANENASAAKSRLEDIQIALESAKTLDFVQDTTIVVVTKIESQENEAVKAQANADPTQALNLMNESQ
jgi:flagellin-like hook-associated protein FlgL